MNMAAVQRQATAIVQGEPLRSSGHPAMLV